MNFFLSSLLPSRPSVHSQPQSCQPSDLLLHWTLLLLSAGILAAAIVLTIGDSGGVLLPVVNRPLPELCALKRLTGLSCPGCGLTRCFISLAHGNFAAAWSFNPAGLWLFAIVTAQLPLRSYQLWRIRRGQRELQLASLGAIAFLVFLIAVLGQWLTHLATIYL